MPGRRAAPAPTLPRQRERVIIKWAAFALISLDLIFGSLHSFQYTDPGNTRPKNFTDAIPALSYLFQLSLGLLYAAWVIYYALSKKRYAFYHPQMRNGAHGVSPPYLEAQGPGLQDWLVAAW